jgi:hypothetical protein
MKTSPLPNHKKWGWKNSSPQLVKMDLYRVAQARKLKPAKRKQKLEPTSLSAKSHSENPQGIQGTCTAG